MDSGVLLKLDGRDVLIDGRVACSHGVLLSMARRGADLGSLLALPDQRVDRYNSVAPRQIKQSDGSDAHAVPDFRWPTPSPYAEMDVESVALELCQSDAERARVSAETAAMRAVGAEPLFRHLAWLASEWRRAGVVWGAGRGSSCAVFTLYLLGVHRVDSLAHEIPMEEFFR